MEQKIIDAYIAYVLEHGEQPQSVFAFAKQLEMEENEFYKYFASFAVVEKQILLSIFNETKLQLTNDEVFKSYGAREKMLAFFYAWIEHARNKRSYLLQLHGQSKLPTPVPAYLNGIKDEFKAFAQEILNEGIESHEVSQRKYISDKYPDALWVQFAFIHQFWLKDHSTDFEKTDAAIEKSLQLAFELMGKGVLDAAIDFGKFLFQNRKMNSN
jgi:hypothetical protein